MAGYRKKRTHYKKKLHRKEEIEQATRHSNVTQEAYRSVVLEK